MSVSPLIARQIPIREGDKVTGFVDLALERAFHYRPGKDSEQIEMPADLQEREAEARTHMLEQLADHDDELLEQLLMDEAPSQDRILQDLARETGESLGVPVLFGSAGSAWGVRRLLKALRHEAPAPEAAARRLSVTAPALHVFKINHGGSVGRLALARALGGSLAEGSDIKTGRGEPARLGALFRMQGDKTQKVAEARDGDIVAVAKIDMPAPAGAGQPASAETCEQHAAERGRDECPGGGHGLNLPARSCAGRLSLMLFELKIPLPDVVSMQCRQESLEGTGEIKLRRVVKEALRMRAVPDHRGRGAPGGMPRLAQIDGQLTGDELASVRRPLRQSLVDVDQRASGVGSSGATAVRPPERSHDGEGVRNMVARSTLTCLYASLRNTYPQVTLALRSGAPGRIRTCATASGGRSNEGGDQQKTVSLCFRTALIPVLHRRPGNPRQPFLTHV